MTAAGYGKSASSTTQHAYARQGRRHPKKCSPRRRLTRCCCISSSDTISWTVRFLPTCTVIGREGGAWWHQRAAGDRPRWQATLVWWAGKCLTDREFLTWRGAMVRARFSRRKAEKAAGKRGWAEAASRCGVGAASTAPAPTVLLDLGQAPLCMHGSKFWRGQEARTAHRVESSKRARLPSWRWGSLWRCWTVKVWDLVTDRQLGGATGSRAHIGAACTRLSSWPCVRGGKVLLSRPPLRSLKACMASTRNPCARGEVRRG